MDNRFEKFTALMTSIGRSIRKIKSEEMVEFNLKGPHVTCLYFLRVKGPLTARELCELCEEDKSNMSRILEYLEKNGFVTCMSSGTRRYRSPHALSEKGIKVSELIARKIENVLLIAGEGVAEEGRQIMYDCLDRINTNLQKICEEYSE